MKAPEYFFIIGAMKAGTTSLYNYLAGHPELYASPKKEPRVFRDEADREVLKQSFAALFEGRGSERWCFEGSTAYTKHPKVTGVPERLASIVPDARLIYLVRDPVDRIWSQYLHNLANGRETRSLVQAVAAEPQYLDISRYNTQLRLWLNVFRRDRIQIQVFEELVADPRRAVRAVCEFLDVDPAYEPSTAAVAFNASGDKVAAPPVLQRMRALGVHDRVPWRVRRWLKDRGTPLPGRKTQLTDDVRASLAEALRPDTEAFFDLFGRRIESWRSIR